MFFAIHVNSFAIVLFPMLQKTKRDLEPLTYVSTCTSTNMDVANYFMLYFTAPLTDPIPSTHPNHVPSDKPVLCTQYMNTTNTTDDTIKAHQSGALRLYRITLWIIALTLALLSIIVSI